MKVKRLLFLIMAICLANGVRAQGRVYNSEVLFFHYYENTKDGAQPSITNPGAQIRVIRVKNGYLNLTHEYFSQPISGVIKNLKSNINYYDNIQYDKLDWSFDSEMSNSKWTVWSSEAVGITWYIGLKNDFSEFMEWREPETPMDFENEATVVGRRCYKGYSKQQILRTSLGGKRDFLN